MCGFQNFERVLSFAPNTTRHEQSNFQKMSGRKESSRACESARLVVKCLSCPTRKNPTPEQVRKASPNPCNEGAFPFQDSRMLLVFFSCLCRACVDSVVLAFSPTLLCLVCFGLLVLIVFCSRGAVKVDVKMPSSGFPRIFFKQRSCFLFVFF